MKKRMTFKERAKLGMEIISRQPLLTSEEALASVRRLHDGRLPRAKKKRTKGNPK